MKIVANGCSQTFGSGLSGMGTDPRDWPGDMSDEETIEINRQYALANSWPAQLAKKLNCGYVNLSRPGGSNDRIVRTTLQYLTKERNTQDHLVVIGWTDPARREVHLLDTIGDHNPYCAPDGYHAFLPAHTDGLNNDWHHHPQWEKWADNHRRYGWDDTESFVRYYTQLLLLTAYLKNNNIPYLYFQPLAHDPVAYYKVPSMMEEYTRRMTQHLYQAINWNDFIETDDQTNDKMMEIFRCQLDNTGHFTLMGHEQVAKILHSELIKRSMI